ncbi:hypothetical protein JCM10296v2_006745 [Rhodotorula toruloides]
MTDARPLAFELPPLRAIAVAIPLFILAVLLQPSVSARTSRRLRLALLVPTAVLGWISPFRWRIEPVEFAIAANFRWGIFSPYFLMLAVWFGAMGESERKNEFAWLGFDGKVEKKALGVEEGSTGHTTSTKENGNVGLRPRANGTLVAPKPRPVSPLASPTLSLISNSSLNEQLPTPSPSPPVDPVQPPSIVDAPPSSVNVPTLTSRKNATRSYSQRHHPLRILLDAAHLLSAMRMIGYAGGPRARDLPPAPKNVKTFFRDRLVTFYSAHLISSACLALQVLDRDGVLASYLSYILPHNAAVFVSATLARLCIGVSLWVQMKIGFNGFAILFYLLHRGTNAFLDTLQAILPRRWSADLTWRSRFDVREYPALFDSPFSKMGEGGVTKFWSARWHFLFRATFTSLGYKPTLALSKRLGIPKHVAQLLGAFVVFTLSAWMHWQALVSARYNLHPSPAGLAFAATHSIPLSSIYPPPSSSLSFLDRNGTFVFFLLQPVAVFLERLWVALTRKRVRGWAGKVWTSLWIVVLGQAVVGKSWLALGLVHGLPPLYLWSWHRFVLPTCSLAPMPAFMR